VCVIGAGPVGRTLAGAWRSAGHDVSVAVRDPDDPKHADIREGLTLVRLGAWPETDATLLAVPGPAVAELVSEHSESLDGRVLLDATNNMALGSLHQLPLLLNSLPSCLVYRGFNTFGWEAFRSDIAGEQPDLLYSGPETNERRVIERLVADTGMRPVYVGAGLDAADVLDGLARLWWVLAFRRGFDHSLALRLLEGDQAGKSSDEPESAPDNPQGERIRLRVAIIGTGKIGRALGTAFVRAGHEVTLGARRPAEATSIEPLPKPANIVSIPDALVGADAAVLAVPATAVSDIASEHRTGLSGPLVIDATNNLGRGQSNNSRELIAGVVGDLRYARAFNTLGVETLRQPYFAGTAADMFFSSEEKDRALVADLIRAVELRPVWLGEHRHAVVDDAFRLWLSLAGTRGRHLALRVLTHEDSRL
jgi:8-hydroxy-5-deazaflavin:NADPH oxidoreductase